jgi:hypothetical protein
LPGYGERRGVSMPESEIVVASAAREAEQAQRITAGRAGFRERYSARQQQHQQAQALANRWDQLIDVYWAALPGLATDDATLGKAREQLLAVGRELRERPDLAAVLRERGEAFGMAKRPNFQRVVADAQPERVIARILKRSEHEMRVEQAQQAEREQEQQRHAYRERWPVARDVR